jgi:fumarate reductase iron-sulfur subunit
MSEKRIKLQISRFVPGRDAQPYLQGFEVPSVAGMSVMQALDYIFEHMDSSLAYYSHSACSQGICGQCSVLINGKTGLLCQTPVEDGMVLAVRERAKIIKDLVYDRGGSGNDENN